MSVHEPQEVKHEYEQGMGLELGGWYFALWNEHVALSIKWAEFKTLYGHSAERIELLNQVAAHYFGQMQRTMWHDVFLHMARIVDRPTTLGWKNLTIQGLPELLPD